MLSCKMSSKVARLRRCGRARGCLAGCHACSPLTPRQLPATAAHSSSSDVVLYSFDSILVAQHASSQVP